VFLSFQLFIFTTIKFYLIYHLSNYLSLSCLFFVHFTVLLRRNPHLLICHSPDGINQKCWNIIFATVVVDLIIVAVIQVPLDQLPNNCLKQLLLLGPTASHKPNVPRHRHRWIILYPRMMRRLNPSPANMVPIFRVQLLWWPKLWPSLPRFPFPSCLRLLRLPFQLLHPCMVQWTRETNKQWYQ